MENLEIDLFIIAKNGEDISKLNLVPNTLIADIMARCNQARILLPQKQFSKDDTVRLVSGPFDNFLATVESIDENQRVWVLIDLMGQATRTLVKAEKLRYNI